MPRYFKLDKSSVQLVVRESPTSGDMNTEVEVSTALKAVTRKRLVKIQQTEKT
jgi:hypothetical protein